MINISMTTIAQHLIRNNNYIMQSDQCIRQMWTKKLVW